MTCTKFKLTTVAALVFAATNANAALYKVVEVTPSITGASEIFGVAIQPATVSGTESCFTTGTVGGVACDSFKLAGETRNTVEAVSYREEVPFAMDASFRYIQENNDFEDYCYRELRYSTCESWADQRWSTWRQEKGDYSYLNAQAFVEDLVEFTTTNTVITALDVDARPLGIKSNGTDIRNTAIATAGAPDDNDSETRAWGSLTYNSTIYNVGSISTNQTNDEGDVFSSKAAIWDGTTTKEIDWVRSGSAKEGEYLAQGSMRSLTIDNNEIYGVGFNTANGSGDLQDMNASVFVSSGLDLTTATWETRVVSGAEVKSGSSSDDARYSNSVATDINDNLFAVGYAKRNGYVPESGSAGNKIFVVENAAEPEADFLTGGIFFGGSSGEAKAVNNFNEFVGQIDAETTREVDGSERRHRGFIYPYNVDSSIDERRVDIFNSQAWWLDDLTNDGNVSGENNKFRIIDATDINDAGVISATAIKCTVGGTTQPYDTTSHNSYCGGASSNAVEEVVAVKLVPIAGATKDDIQTRSADTEKVDRQGGSLGWLTLTVLGLLGFRRKFK
ncbi:hypothetical protein VCR4J2_120034 [Vibrio coralliirubri]|uniref:DUF3466 family protein n=1 Tax=Vibrio coralliirubri TaxID=1516159 RepID=UPI000638A750|nr:DUF3466 family protein [Vibrio coralliirubri]CDT00699.1 hypothetical protein VCR4J2_120034 [Vibrio coralliirubri]